AGHFGTEDDSETLFTAKLFRERSHSRRNELVVLSGSNLRDLYSLTPQFDIAVVNDIQPRLVQANVVANLPRQQRMLVRRIIANQQNRRRTRHIAHAGGQILFPVKCGSECRKVGCAVMVNIVRSQHHARELLQQVILFVGRASGTDHANRLAAVAIANFLELLSDEFEGFFPRRWNQAPALLHQGLHQAVFVLDEVECVTSLDAEEIAIDATLVAIISANNLHAGIRSAHPQSRLAAVTAVGAGRSDVLHLPRTRLVAICTRSQRADRTYVDTHAALFAFEVIAEIRDNGRT